MLFDLKKRQIDFTHGKGSQNKNFLEFIGASVATVAWDPGAILDGNEEAQAVTVTGAALGDVVLGVSFSLDVADLNLDAHVTAADTVTAVLQNNTGGTIDLGAGTLKVVVVKASAT